MVWILWIHKQFNINNLVELARMDIFMVVFDRTASTKLLIMNCSGQDKLPNQRKHRGGYQHVHTCRCTCRRNYNPL